jgi:hypothetical protein
MVFAIAGGLAAAGSIVAFAVPRGARRAWPGNEQRVLALAVVALLTGRGWSRGLAVDWPEWASGVVSALAVALALLASACSAADAAALALARARGAPWRTRDARDPRCRASRRVVRALLWRGTSPAPPARAGGRCAARRGTAVGRRAAGYGAGAMICPAARARTDEHRYCSQAGRLLEPSSVLAGSLREQLHRGLGAAGRRQWGRAREQQALPRVDPSMARPRSTRGWSIASRARLRSGASTCAARSTWIPSWSTAGSCSGSSPSPRRTTPRPRSASPAPARSSRTPTWRAHGSPRSRSRATTTRRRCPISGRGPPPSRARARRFCTSPPR